VVSSVVKSVLDTVRGTAVLWRAGLIPLLLPIMVYGPCWRCNGSVSWWAPTTPHTGGTPIGSP
jgi:hypothetical protein